MKKIIMVVSIMLLFSITPVYAKQQIIRKAFLPNFNTGTVTIVDLINKNVVGAITAGDRSYGIATRDKSGSVWVGDEIGQKVVKINAFTHEIEAEYYLGHIPVGIAADPNRNRLYVTYNRIEDSSLAIFDIKTGKLIKRVNAGRNAFAVAVNPKNGHIYVVNRYYDETVSFGTLVVVNGGSLEVINEIPVGFDPLGIAVHPTGDYVYTVGDGRIVYIIDTINYSLTGTVGVGYQPWGIATNNEGDRLYVVNRRKDYQTANGSLSVIDLTSLAVIRNVDLGNNPHGVTVSSDDTEVYVAQPGENNLLVIETGDYTITHNIDVGGQPFSVGDFLFEIR